MHYYLGKQEPGEIVSLGSPTLIYTDYCDEQYQQHPRGIHSHHEMAEILYVLRGEGLYEIDGRVYPVRSGDLVVYNTDVVHNECLQSPPPPLYGFGVSGLQLEGLPADCLLPSNISPVISLGERASEFRTLFRLLYEQSRTQTAVSVPVCQALMRALLYLIHGLIDGTAPMSAAVDPKTKSYRLGSRLQDYIDRHALEEISVQSVAQVFEISPTYVSRLFKQTTGSSLMQYVIQRRIGEAQTLLLITDLSITEVARRVGYENLSHFVKMFTQYVGISPRKYRKRGSAVHKDGSGAAE